MVPLASAFPYLRFLGKIPILGVHCLNGLIAQGDTSISLERLSFCQDGDNIQSQRSFISSLLQGEVTSEVTDKTVIAIIRKFWIEGLKL